MSSFGVSIESIASVRTHPGADRLDLCTLAGMSFQVVVKRGEFRAGDRVVYFPVDALLPDELSRRIGLEGRLAGARKNRVKTVCLRGEFSQGLVGPLTLLDGLPDPERTTEGITRFLGVEKHEPPVLFGREGRLLPLPSDVPVYDIEGADRFPSVLETMLDLEVSISEKLEGSHFSVTWKDGRAWVNQRQHTIEPLPGVVHSFWKVAESQGLIDAAKRIGLEAGDSATLHGEFLGPGVQSNIYGLKDHAVHLFDVRVGGRCLAAAAFRELLSRHGVGPVVPEIAGGIRLREWLAGRSIQEASDGRSLLAPVAREGIVVRPMEERFCPELHGRLLLKQRSPAYLAGSDA